MHFFENFYLITGKNNKEKTTKLNNKLHPSVSILCCITSSLDDSFNATSIVSCCVSVVDIHGELPHSNKSWWHLSAAHKYLVDVYATSFSQSPINFRWDSNEVSWQASLTHVRGNSHTMLVWILQSAVEQDPAGRWTRYLQRVDRQLAPRNIPGYLGKLLR